MNSVYRFRKERHFAPQHSQAQMLFSSTARCFFSLPPGILTISPAPAQ